MNYWASHNVLALARILGYWATDIELDGVLLPRVHVLLPVRIARMYRHGSDIYYMTCRYTASLIYNYFPSLLIISLALAPLIYFNPS